MNKKKRKNEDIIAEDKQDKPDRYDRNWNRLSQIFYLSFGSYLTTHGLQWVLFALVLFGIAMIVWE